MKGGTPQTVYLSEYQPPDYLIETVDLEFDLHPNQTRVKARLKIASNNNKNAPLVLAGEQLTLISIKLNDEVLDASQYSLTEEALTLDKVPAQPFVLETEVEIDPANNKSLNGLYQSNDIFCTQCEAEGFRRITYYLDRPDVMAKFSTTIVAEQKYANAMLSNGNMIESTTLDDGRRRVKWQDPFRKPSYLFALVAGGLEFIQDSYTTRSGRKVDLRIYVEPENIDKCAHAMESLKKSMAWDEEVYGLEYDLDIYMIVAVNDFNMGAMENKGLNVFNSKFVLAKPDSATDDDYLGIEGVIAHEYFHNWTGNRVTCRDWFQLSLKEGLTVFRDQEFSTDMNSSVVSRIQDVRCLRSTQFLEDASPMAHPVRPDSYLEINNFYTTTVYNKGAEVVRMYQTLLGKEGFRKGMDLYFQRHDGQAVTTDDFFNAMVDANQVELPGFKNWYAQAGTPRLKVETHYDAKAREFTLKLSQHCPDTPGQTNKQPFLIPVRLGLLSSQGKDLPLSVKDLDESGRTEIVLNFNETAKEYVFTDVSSEPVLSILRGFSAPVIVEYERDLADYAFLLEYDNDNFNRWEASQILALEILKKLVAGEATTELASLKAMYLKAMAIMLDYANVDPALVAEVFFLPTQKYLAEQMQVINVEAIHNAHENLKRSLAESLEQGFLATYKKYHKVSDYSLSPDEISRRKLKNCCLAYLVKLEKSQYFELANQQFTQASNMTDEIAALSMLINTDNEFKQSAIERFYQKWQHDPLVMDKWLAVQAASPLPDALDNVIQLTKHSVFDIKNPNKVRSLLGQFFHVNQLQFNRADGAGYRLLVETVTELDKMNPQVSSSLLKALTRWRRFDTERQKLMKQALESIVALPGLSPDCYEIASKSLR